MNPNECHVAFTAYSLGLVVFSNEALSKQYGKISLKFKVSVAESGDTLAVYVVVFCFTTGQISTNNFIEENFLTWLVVANLF